IRYIMIPTTIGKEFLVKKTDHECTLVVEGMIERVPLLKAEEIVGYAKDRMGSVASGVATVKDNANRTYERAVGYEITDLKRWGAEFERDLITAFGDRDELKKKRDRVDQWIPNAADRVLPFTGIEKIETGFFILLAVIVWLMGYLALVQILRTLDIGLPDIAIYIIPVAGVTALATVVKLILSALRGTASYFRIRLILLVLTATACVAWLVLFSSFVQEIATPIQFISLKGGPPPIQSHTSMGYIIAGVLAESLLAGSLFAYVTDIFHFKTIRDMGTNPQWKELDDAVIQKDIRCEYLQRLIALCDGLVGKIEAGRHEYIGRAEALYMKLRSER
ncbi:MAG: hypothetical protein WAO00_10630, partial [Chthoniobacterales bacterium]